MKLTTHVRLVRRSRMRGAIPQLALSALHCFYGQKKWMQLRFGAIYILRDFCISVLFISVVHSIFVLSSPRTVTILTF